MMHDSSPDRFAHLRVLTMKQVCELTTYTPQHINRLIRAGQFPKRRRMGANRQVFLQREYESWFAARPVDLPPDDPDDTNE